MISLPKHNWIKQSDRTCASRFIATVTSSCRQVKRLELESLSKELAGVSEVSFTEFAAEKATNWKRASRQTVAHRQLTKFAGSGGGLTINFDAMLLGERIFWDPATDTLTIKGTPPNLRAINCSAGRLAAINRFCVPECQMRRERLIWPAKNSNTVIRHNL